LLFFNACGCGGDWVERVIDMVKAIFRVTIKISKTKKGLPIGNPFLFIKSTIM